MTPLDYQPPPARRPITTTDVVVLGLIAFAALVDLPRKISVMGTSGLGAETLLASGLIVAVFLMRPVVSKLILAPVLPLILFNIDAAGTRLWSSTGIDGTQLQVIGISFVGMMIVCARESAADPNFARNVHRVILWGSLMSTVFSFHASYTAGADGEGLLMSRRPFALYAMTVVAVAVAAWQSAPVHALAMRYFFWALTVTAAVACTQSRTALIACLFLFPLAIALRLTKKSITVSVVLTILVTAAFAAVVMSYQPLYDRFFANDASIKVGSVAINSSGRSKIWQLVLDSIGDDWIFGKGIAMSIETVRAVFPDVGQPHNDYLRFYFDQGIVGLGLWICFVLAYLYRAVGDLRLAIRFAPQDRQFHVAAILGFVAVLISMGTDNTYVYGFVMIPMGAIIGTGLGTGARLKSALTPVDDFQMPYVPARGVTVS